jgi:hypothetical protein
MVVEAVVEATHPPSQQLDLLESHHQAVDEHYRPKRRHHPDPHPLSSLLQQALMELETMRNPIWLLGWS